MRHERSTSPRPPRRDKMAFRDYRETSPPRRQDTPEPTRNYRGSGVSSLDAGESEEFIPVQPAIYAELPKELRPPPDYSCRDCMYFTGLQLTIIVLVAAITYSIYVLYKI